MANPNYWEREYRSTLNETYKAKIEILLSMIPNDVKSISDIGCGNGVITNELAKTFQVTGVDRSRVGLKTVYSQKLLASCDNLPIHSDSFDLVFSSEMLEHLEDDLFYSAVTEIERLTKKYILLTVPYDENVRKNLVECPECKTRFNKTYHYRRLNKKVLQDLFFEYDFKAYLTFGKKVRGYNSLLEKIKHNFAKPNSWIPPRWTPDGYRTTVCSNCSLEFEIPYQFNFISFFCDYINVILTRKKNYQLFILFSKR